MAVFVSPTAGTRNIPTDNLIFTRGTTAKFKIMFTSNAEPVAVDIGTDPFIKIVQPAFVNNLGSSPVDNVLFTTVGSLVAGQQFEYEFDWPITGNIVPSDEYIVTYHAVVGGLAFEYGSELFTITAGPGIVGVRSNFYATVDDIRSKKFTIDDYLPKIYAKDLTTRNKLIESHIKDGTDKLREELNLSQSRSNSVNYRLFVTYYTVWSILLSSRGEDGSSVSDSNIAYWRAEWESILAQEKRSGIMQGIPMGRG